MIRLLYNMFDYLKDIVTFNFGNALTQGERPIKDELGERLPATLELSIPSLIFTSLFGIALGAYASKNRKKAIDYIIRLFSIFIYSIPIFFLGLLFQVIFGVRLNWLPLAGRMDPVSINDISIENQFLHHRFNSYAKLACAWFDPFTFDFTGSNVGISPDRYVHPVDAY